MHGRTGPLKEFYQSEIVPDNITRTKVDMQQLKDLSGFVRSIL